MLMKLPEKSIIKKITIIFFREKRVGGKEKKKSKKIQRSSNYSPFFFKKIV